MEETTNERGVKTRVQFSFSEAIASQVVSPSIEGPDSGGVKWWGEPSRLSRKIPCVTEQRITVTVASAAFLFSW